MQVSLVEAEERKAQEAPLEERSPEEIAQVSCCGAAVWGCLLQLLHCKSCLRMDAYAYPRRRLLWGLQANAGSWKGGA
jgi:hypothetical protein